MSSFALRQAIRYRADASIILSGMPISPSLQLCLKNGQRLVLINRDDEQDGPLRINLDDEEAANRVVTAFLRAGCRKFAFANSEAGTPSLMAREKGFVAAARTHGLDAIVERYGWTSYESGRVLAQRLLTQSQRPDAVFCATDLLACGFMDAAHNQFFPLRPQPTLCRRFRRYRAGLLGILSTDDLCPTARHDRAGGGLVARQQGGCKPEKRTPAIRLHADLVWRGSIRGLTAWHL